MNKISEPTLQESSYSESRREMRRRLEKGAADNAPDRIQLNDIVLFLLVAVTAVISFTDFSLSIKNIISLTALTVFLYVVTSMIYRNRYAKGRQRGKRDPEYKDSLLEYRRKRQKIYDDSCAGLVPEFCKHYKTRELREYRESLLTDVEVEYDEYLKKYRRLPDWDVLKLHLPWDIKKTIIKCNRAKPLRLVPGLILNENGEMDREKLLGQSGREREKRDKRQQLISRAVIVIFSSTVAINLVFNFSLVTVIQWMVRMIPIISALFAGDDAGYCNITVTETNFKRDQISVINLFNEYVECREAAPSDRRDASEACADKEN